jgi:hypothetical protein
MTRLIHKSFTALLFACAVLYAERGRRAGAGDDRPVDGHGHGPERRRRAGRKCDRQKTRHGLERQATTAAASILNP